VNEVSRVREVSRFGRKRRRRGRMASALDEPSNGTRTRDRRELIMGGLLAGRRGERRIAAGKRIPAM
jgi:hypothetical protein